MNDVPSSAQRPPGLARRSRSLVASLEGLLACLQLAEEASGREPADRGGTQDVFTVIVIRGVARTLLHQHGLPVPSRARLFVEASSEDPETFPEVAEALDRVVSALLLESAAHFESIPEVLGGVFEALLALDFSGESAERRLALSRGRRKTGSFFTPASLADRVIESALREASALESPIGDQVSTCDPACGAGAFLLAAARALVASRRHTALARGEPIDELRLRRQVVETCLAGVDLSPIAVGVCELSLWAYVGDPEFSPTAIQVHVGDAISGRGFAPRSLIYSDPRGLDWPSTFPGICERGFDLVVGNPPWIAYAGRASHPLARERRRFMAENYRAFRGYPTLHAVFVERAAELAPKGVVALLVPSPLADLDGYRPTRLALGRSHQVCEPMLEFGQDAFAEVTQPCFALVARPRRPGSDELAEPGRPFRLIERAHSDGIAKSVEVPEALLRLRELPRLPREVFREMGLQTTREVTRTMLKRSDNPDDVYSYALLEGRQVGEFRVGPPRLFLNPDADLLKRARCRLRPAEEYERVEFVVRQTAKVPIAALHTGLPFRNTLLAGLASAELSASVLVGLLNSSLYRALHLAMQRDARQAVFPQVKLAHLRALPRPPFTGDKQAACIAELTSRATSEGMNCEIRRELDSVVFGLFGFTEKDRSETLAFLGERAAELLERDHQIERPSIPRAP